MGYLQILSPIYNFLYCKTPQARFDKTRDPTNLSLLLTDHLICELKTAQMTMLLVREYVADEQELQALLDWLKSYEAFAFKEGGEPDSTALNKQIGKSVIPQTDDPWGCELIDSMVLFIKEELHHPWQVREAMISHSIPYIKITASRYARGMLKEVRTHKPLALIDKLICGAYTETCSCERFAVLASYLDDDLQASYLSLLRLEIRHYQGYLALAQQVSVDDIGSRVRFFDEVEVALITSPDDEFRPRSGVPA